MTGPRIPDHNVIDQAGWQHPSPYPDYSRWANYAPNCYVLHYTGYGADIRTTAQAKASARSVRRYHVEVRGWHDIAYNVYAWFPLLRLRGMNHNGANKDSAYWGGRTLTCYFPTGLNYPTPHRRMLKGFCWMWALAPAPVTGHGLLPPSPSGVEQDTECPGPWLRNFIWTEGWLDVLARGNGRPVSWRHEVAKRRLAQLGRWDPEVMGLSRVRSPEFVEAVRMWQVSAGLPVNGRLRRADWERLCAY